MLQERHQIEFNEDTPEIAGSCLHGTSTDKGPKADPAKLEAVFKMPTPNGKHEVLRFLRMMNYLSKFIPQLSELCAPLRQVTQKENYFTWHAWNSSVHTPCFKRKKSLLTEAHVLKYFDPKEGQIVLQCDALQYGLGACLMQNQQPVAYASRALSTNNRVSLCTN